jgi:D-alanine-D-alanine ligase
MRIALTYNEKRSAGEAHAEFDSREAIAQIARLVASLGHSVVPMDVSGSIPRIAVRLRRVAPELILNFAEGERGTFREAFYPALFEQLGFAHTGSSASTLALCLDKALAKRVVAAARVRVPRGRIVRRADELCDLPGPLIVKPNFEGSSKGITPASVVADPGGLAEVIRPLLARYPEGVLVEEFVDGIDVAVGWFAGIGMLPPICYRYDARGGPAIYDYALKHVTPERVHVEVPAVLACGVAPRLEQAAARAFEALGVAGYGRADFRITAGGDIVFLELNPLPSLTLAAGHDELYLAAAELGRSPRDLLAAVIADEPAPLRRTA